MAKSKKSKKEDKIVGGVPGVVENVHVGADLAKEEAEEANVTPQAVMRSAPEGGVTGDGVVMDPSGEETGDEEDVD